jgi:predicted peroxiredoxin
MARILFQGTCGSENPTRAALPLLGAIGTVEAGHQAMLALVGDAVVMMKTPVANAVVPVGWPPYKDLLAKVVEYKIPIYV